MIGRVIVAGLAGERLRRAWQDEVIGQGIRKRIFEWTSVAPITDDPKADHRAATRREFVDELTACPHCLGFWLTLVATVGLRVKLVRVVIEGLAAAMLLSTIVERVGWSGRPSEHEATS